MDEIEFIALVRATEAALRCYLTALGVGRSDVDDLTQETYLELHRRPQARPSGVAMLAWLKGIARNLAREHFRRRQRGKAIFHHLGSAVEAAQPAGDDDGEEAVERLSTLRRCLQLLRPEQRAVLDAWCSGMSLPAMGDEALRKRALRLRQALRDRLVRRRGADA